MIKKIYLTVIAIVAFGFAGIAQNKGAIKVTLIDEKTKEPLPFANAIVLMNGSQVGTGTTDFDGNAIIKPLDPGKYSVKAVYVGYQPKEVSGVVVAVEKTSYLTIALSNAEGVKLDEVVITEYQEPLIDPDTKSGGTVTREEYQNMATKNVLSVASTTAGVFQADEGSGINVRGSRSSGTNIFIDGERAIGTTGIAQQAVEQVTTTLGGVPASFGDATGGVISITTRAPKPKYEGNVELISSQLTDKFGYNFLGFSVGGPIITKKDSSGNKRSMLGFFLAGEIVDEKDPDPSAVGVWKVKDDKLKEIEQTPIIRTESGIFYRSAEFITMNDLEKIKTRQNVRSTSIRLNPKIQFVPNPNLTFTLGGSFDYNRRHDFVYTYALFNTQNNPQVIDNTWRVYGRVTQKFGKESASEQDKSQSIIKNAFFNLQASYQRYQQTVQDDTHKDKVFNYGYVGKFNTYSRDFYAPINNAQVQADLNGDGIADTTYSFAGESPNVYQFSYDSLLTFTPGTLNPLAANYTTQVFDYYNSLGFDVSSIGEVALNNGLINGIRPGNIHALWLPTGRQYGGYSKVDNSMIRLTSSFSADIKNHAIQVGIEVDQRNNASYSVNDAPGLWTRMRQLANQHYYNRNKLNPIIDTIGSEIYVNYDANYTLQSHFSKVMYEAMGMPAQSSSFIDVDSFDPSFFNLGMLTPDEILNQGNGSLVDAFGFDYQGNKLKKTISFDDFMNKSSVDRFGDTIYDRLVGAFRPTYFAGYIQDKFDFKDLKFNVGLRFDIFDANQKVLADKYLFKPAFTRGQAAGKNLSGYDLAQGVSDDAVVYVDDYNASTPTVVGYRDGDTWYDVNGNVVTDPKLIADKTSTGTITPYLNTKPEDEKYSYTNSAFTDYKPQLNVMPRIAFAFPISDVSNFFAHYDVLVQRPTTGNRLDPKDYMYISSIVSGQGVIANPNLKPEKTIDYELGFAQILNERKNAVLKITSFYREMRNMVQITRLFQAYPYTYLTYGNLDFGTVKGFSVEFELRRTNGVQMNANYTLQFAEGTGSNPSGGYTLASGNSSQPNLRSIRPLDFDQRHTFTFNFDYRFGEGRDYRGPKYTRKKGETEKTYEILKNVGANLLVRLGSGTPYTAKQQPTSDVLLGYAANTTIAGNLNGYNLPWTFRADLRVDKNFDINWGKKGDDNARVGNLNIYLQVLNVLNAKNVIAVHSYTGSPTDDGFLSSPAGQTYQNNILAQGGQPYLSSFLDLYNARLLDPGYYSRPRVIRLGLVLDF